MKAILLSAAAILRDPVGIGERKQRADAYAVIPGRRALLFTSPLAGEVARRS